MKKILARVSSLVDKWDSCPRKKSESENREEGASVKAAKVD